MVSQRSPRLVGVGITAFAVSIVVACGSSGPATTMPGGGGGGGSSARYLVFNATVNLTGPVSGQAMYTDSISIAKSVAADCGAYAAHGAGGAGYIMPATSNTAQLGGKKLDVLGGEVFSAYHGPGTYTTAQVSIIVGGDVLNTVLGSVTLTVNSDASGTLTLNQVPVTSSSSMTDSGTISWTCS